MSKLEGVYYRDGQLQVRWIWSDCAFILCAEISVMVAVSAWRAIEVECLDDGAHLGSRPPQFVIALGEARKCSTVRTVQHPERIQFRQVGYWECSIKSNNSQIQSSS